MASSYEEVGLREMPAGRVMRKDASPPAAQRPVAPRVGRPAAPALAAYFFFCRLAPSRTRCSHGLEEEVEAQVASEKQA